MRPSNKASRNVWVLLTIVGIATFVVGILSVINDPADIKSWSSFFIGIAILVSFCKKFLFYQRLVNRGIEYNAE